MKQTKEIKEFLERYINEKLPAIAVLGKIVKVYEKSGKAHFLNCVYSADVELLELDEEGNFKDSGLPIPDVPILSIGIGNNRGIFFLPAVNSIVKVSFLYGSLDYPVIDGVLPYFSAIPEHNKDDLTVEVPQNILIEAKGNITIKAKGNILIDGNRIDLNP
ncbi:MAG: hypothetical protein DSY59_04005 [Persephonella sp.]|nr:MAG: hypothetical protein DSY59_04005 [Persephonella sp.]